MKRSSLNRLVRQARAPKADAFAGWMRLLLLLFAVVGLVLLQDRLGLAGANCFANLAGSPVDTSQLSNDATN